MIIVESIQEIYDTPKVVTDYSPPHRDLHDINYSPIKTSNPIEITETYLFLSPPLSKNKTNKKKKKNIQRTISTSTPRSFVLEIELTRAIRNGRQSGGRNNNSVKGKIDELSRIYSRAERHGRSFVYGTDNARRSRRGVAWLLNGKFIDPRVPRRCVSY